MKTMRTFLPLLLVLISTPLFAQAASAGARAKAREDSVRAPQRAAASAARQPRHTEQEESAHARAQRAEELAIAARERVEAVDTNEAEHHARMEAQIAAETIASGDWGGLAEELERVGETMPELARLEQLEALSGLSGLAGLSELAALSGLSALAHTAPMPGIPPMTMIGPMPPPPLTEAIGVGESYSGPRRYHQYLSEAEQTRLKALHLLLQNDEQLALPEVKNFMREENWALRAAALEMLGQTEHREAVAILREALQHETDKRVKSAAIRALAQHDAPEAREALRELLQNK